MGAEFGRPGNQASLKRLELRDDAPFDAILVATVL